MRTLGDVVTGKAPGRERADQIMIYSIRPEPRLRTRQAPR